MATVGELAQRYVAGRVARKEVSLATGRSFRQTLWLFARHVGPRRDAASIGRRQVESWMEAQDVSPATLRLRLSTLRGFFAWAVVEGHCPRDPTLGVKRPRRPRRVPRQIAAADATRLLRGAKDARERLILALELYEGLRACEVAWLELADVDLHDKLLTVLGKGKSQRVLPIVGETQVALTAYLAERGRHAGKLIQAVGCWGRQADGGIAPKRVQVIVAEAMRREGIRESGHACRHAFSHRMVDAGADVWTIRDALGHVSIATTEIYGPRMAVSRLREAMERVHYDDDPEVA